MNYNLTLPNTKYNEMIKFFGPSIVGESFIAILGMTNINVTLEEHQDNQFTTWCTDNGIVFVSI